jgi:hypothetical protein
MKAVILGVGILLLAGCGTPQERCIAAATRDMRVVDRLIAEVQGNLDRGYALEQVSRPAVRWVVCERGRPATATRPAQAPQMCLQDYQITSTQPRAINLADERQTLAELKAKRAAQAKATAPAVAQCRQAHPE